MAPALPKTFALYSPQNNKYLSYVVDDGMVEGFLKFSADDYNTDLTKFEVVESSSGDGLVHIKSSYNNKFWRRWSSNLYWIAADADAPFENKSKWSCTLFEPVFVNGDRRTIQLKHVHLRRNAFSSVDDYEPYTYCFSTAPKSGNGNMIDTFRIIDLAPSPPEKEDPKRPLVRPEDEKPVKRPDEDVKPPKKPEGPTTDEQTEPADEHSSEETKSPLKKYEIVDVKYDVVNAKISVTDPDAIYLPVRNEGGVSEERVLTFNYNKTEKCAWNSTGENSKISEINPGVVTELRSAIPVLVNEKTVLLGPEFVGPFLWGEDLMSQKTMTSKHKAIVPAKTHVTLSLETAKASVTVPFSYTRRDTHVNGARRTHKNLKGEYKGEHVYKFMYGIHEVEDSDTWERRSDMVK